MTDVTDAMLQWRSRTVVPTGLSSADLRGIGSELYMRSVISARVTNAEFLAEIANVIDDMLSGKINQAGGRAQLFLKLKELGYDPEVGFPDDMGRVPPALRGSLRDISSVRRLNLILETNERIAASYGQMVAGNTEYARRAYPAWELVRFFPREVPRGSVDSHSVGWQRRWADAGDSVDWEGAVLQPMIARKDSPIWQALGDGVGGYTDTLGNPFPPFAFNSGMDWVAVDRERCKELGLIGNDAQNGMQDIPDQAVGRLDPETEELRKWFKNLPEDLREEMEVELNTDKEREFLRREQEAHEQRMAGVLEKRRADREQRHAELRRRLVA